MMKGRGGKRSRLSKKRIDDMLNPNSLDYNPNKIFIILNQKQSKTKAKSDIDNQPNLIEQKAKTLPLEQAVFSPTLTLPTLSNVDEEENFDIPTLSTVNEYSNQSVHESVEGIQGDGEGRHFEKEKESFSSTIEDDLRDEDDDRKSVEDGNSQYLESDLDADLVNPEFPSKPSGQMWRLEKCEIIQTCDEYLCEYRENELSSEIELQVPSNSARDSNSSGNFGSTQETNINDEDNFFNNGVFSVANVIIDDPTIESHDNFFDLPSLHGNNESGLNESFLHRESDDDDGLLDNNETDNADDGRRRRNNINQGARSFSMMLDRLSQ